MKLSRRRFLRLAMSAGVLPSFSESARSQPYPSRPVHLVVGFPSGYGADIIARALGDWLSSRLGQTFIIEDRPGANSNVAADAVLRADPDGQTLLMATSADMINASLYENLFFDFARDGAPVAGVIQAPYVLMVNPSFPAKTVPELIAYAKANPDKIMIGSQGIGSLAHLSGELFEMMAGIDMLHVPLPYRAVADLIAGRVQAYFGALVEATINNGKVRVLAVTTAERSAAFPDIPTIAEFVPGYESSLIAGVVAPRRTPADIVAKLNEEINAGLSDPNLKARLAKYGSIIASLPEDFGRLVASEIEKWAKVEKFAGIKLP